MTSSAFTNASGYWNQPLPSGMVTYSKIKWGSLAGTVYRGYLPGPTVNNESYKAPTTSGGSPGGWRYPTNYSRCVASV